LEHKRRLLLRMIIIADLSYFYHLYTKIYPKDAFISIP